jgi:hypothetical protein
VFSTARSFFPRLDRFFTERWAESALGDRCDHLPIEAGFDIEVMTKRYLPQKFEQNRGGAEVLGSAIHSSSIAASQYDHDQITRDG